MIARPVVSIQLLLLFLIGGLSVSGRGADANDWTTSFASPPDSARTHTWWHWMDGNVSRVGITADLEAMHRVGIRSATIVTVGLNIPKGPVKYLSPEWLGMVQFAASEAHRLGMKLGMGNCAGWSSSGGPWVTPENSMMMVVESEKQLTGPRHFSDTLPQPETLRGFYREIQTIAIPTSPEEAVTMQSLNPKITGSDPAFDGSQLNNTPIQLPTPTPAQPQYVQFEFAAPYQVRTVQIDVGGVRGQAEIQTSDDGQNFRTAQTLSLNPEAGLGCYGVAPVSARFFRLVFLQISPVPKQFQIAGITLSSAPRISDYRRKALFGHDREDSAQFTAASTADVPIDAVIQPDRIIDLTKSLDATGKLDWQVPPGRWTVLRFGYTTTGVTNHPVRGGDGQGLECDKLSRKAAQFYWDGFMPKIQKTLGPLMGGTFDHILIDSYEIGYQNWTPEFRQEFQRRCGYDLLRFLPVLTGRFVDSPEKSERFLWDFRRTVTDLFAENYYDYFEVMAHRTGLKLEVEPYGNGPFEDLRSARDADRVMGEFWWPDAASIETLKLASSVAHVNGKTIVGAESFTSGHGQWDMSPPTMKALGDMAFVDGINSYDFHRYVHQPWLNREPGLTLGKYGSTLERTNNWWEQSVGWEQYLARCCFLLQQGHFVADLLYADDEGAPASCPAPSRTGYDYDCTDQDALLHLLTVKNGRLTLLGGMSYRALVLSPARQMTPTLLRKLKDLADGGAIIIAGPKPNSSPSLVNYPACDDEVKKLSDALWDTGKIVSGKPESDVLRSRGVRPDFQCTLSVPPAYIHRALGDRDIYFLSNQRLVDEDADCTFRVTGKIPQLWHPDTGQIEKIAVYADDGQATHVPIHLDPSGSVFVVFEPRPRAPDHAVSVTRTDTPDEGVAPASLVIRHASYGGGQQANVMDVTAQLSALIKNGALSLVVNNAAFGQDPSAGQDKILKVIYVLDGQEMKKTIREGGLLDVVAPRAAPPAYALDFKPGGTGLEVWKPGTYQIKMATGPTITKKVVDLPPPLEVSGEWNLSFQPDRGAPAQATFDKLISWSDSADPGVKYFSGTATYSTTLQIPSEMLGPGRHVYLDLGDVQVIAQAGLNGKDLGLLWKPPYRVNITPVAHVGANVLTVSVTNLWPNRLIGDEQLPPDVEWDPTGGLKRFPQWLLDGKPSPTGRITFASWRHFTKDSPLMPSGLIGPVTLVPSVDLPMP